jgi:hypothetical protein
VRFEARCALAFLSARGGGAPAQHLPTRTGTMVLLMSLLGCAANNPDHVGFRDMKPTRVSIRMAGAVGRKMIPQRRWPLLSKKLTFSVRG